MITSLHRERTLDLTHAPLGPGWLRVRPTKPETREVPGSGVFRTGPELRFRRELIAGLAGAEEVALVSSFLLSDGHLAEAMLEAATRGVRVYVLTASEQRIGTIVLDDESFEKRMANEHKKLLERLAGKVLLRSAEHIHAKFLVVDPEVPSRARAWLSTANFNRALEDGIELGVALDAAGARALAECFRWAFWCEAEREQRGAHQLVEIRSGHPAAPKRPMGELVHATLKNGTALRDRVLALVRDARQEILVASYGIGADHLAVRALADAAKRGVRVTMLTRPRRAVAAGVAALTAAGVTVVAHDNLHAKALVVDGRALVMSANFEAHGLDAGFEVGAMLSPEGARSVEATLREWAATFPWIYRANATRGDHLGDFCPADAGPRDGVVRVTEVHAHALGDVTADDALLLDRAPDPALTAAAPRKELPRRVAFRWDVIAPTLPKGAVERLQKVERVDADKDGKPKTTVQRIPHDPRVFDHGGKVYVLVGDAEDAAPARTAAAKLGATVVVARPLEPATTQSPSAGSP